jgi:hypothetical protein
MKQIFALLGLISILIPLAYAHQPRIVFDQNASIENPVKIEDPEISKAYYGNLKGSADFYKIESFQPFKLYLNILAPDLSDSRTDFDVDIISQNKTLFVLNGTAHDWTKFHEEFAGDNYIQGPEIEKNMSAGDYYIKVYSKDNEGKYSLAVGDVESFPPKESIRVLLSLPRIKSDFFEKPAYHAYFGKIGMFLLVPLVILLIIILILLFWAIRRKRDV